MTTNNYSRAEKELEAVKLNNIRIKLNKGTNQKQCTNMTIYDIEDEILEEKFSTSNVYNKGSFEIIYLYLDKKYGLKKYCAEPPKNIPNCIKSLGREIINCVEDTLEDMCNYPNFRKSKRPLIPCFYAYFGLIRENYKIFYKNNSCIQFDENKKYNHSEIGKIFHTSGEAIRQNIERALFYIKLRFLNKFENYIYKINYILNNVQNYIILENPEDFKIYKMLLDELFEDYGDNISFDIDFSVGIITKNNVSLEDLMNDDTVPVDIRKKIEKLYNKNSIYINGTRLIDNRKELMKYCLKTYCTTPTKLENIKKRYKKMLIENNLGNRNDLIYDDRTLENALTRFDNVLLSLGKDYRYYEPQKMKEASQALNLCTYNNVIISANKIYKSNLDLMNKYDIRNCYELHNLLNKNINDNNITFKRMPTICFGNANRDSQVLELLKKMSPVSAKNLASAYEDKYGDALETVLSNYLNSVEQYKVGTDYVYHS